MGVGYQKQIQVEDKGFSFKHVSLLEKISTVDIVHLIKSI